MHSENTHLFLSGLALAKGLPTVFQDATQQLKSKKEFYKFGTYEETY